MARCVCVCVCVCVRAPRYRVLHDPYLLAQRRRSSAADSGAGDGSTSPTHQSVPPSDLSWWLKVKMLLQCASGMAFLHSCSPPVLHRDLKSPNVLVRDGDGVVKVCDFGLSMHRGVVPSAGAPRPANAGEWTPLQVRGDSMLSAASDTPDVAVPLQHAIGTCQWSAPEVLRGEVFSRGADVYSFGVIAWETASAAPPFGDMSALRVGAMVGHCGVRLPLPPRLDAVGGGGGAAVDDGQERKSSAEPQPLAAVRVPFALAKPPRPSQQHVGYGAGVVAEPGGGGGGGGGVGASTTHTPVLDDVELYPCPAPLRAIIQECFSDNPGMRPSFEELVPRLSRLVQALSPPSSSLRGRRRL